MNVRLLSIEGCLVFGVMALGRCPAAETAPPAPKPSGHAIEFSTPKGKSATTNVAPVPRFSDSLPQFQPNERGQWDFLKPDTPGGTLPAPVAVAPLVVPSRQMLELLEARKNWATMTPETLLGVDSTDETLNLSLKGDKRSGPGDSPRALNHTLLGADGDTTAGDEQLLLRKRLGLPVARSDRERTASFGERTASFRESESAVRPIPGLETDAGLFSSGALDHQVPASGFTFGRDKLSLFDPDKRKFRQDEFKRALDGLPSSVWGPGSTWLDMLNGAPGSSWQVNGGSSVSPRPLLPGPSAASDARFAPLPPSAAVSLDKSVLPGDSLLQPAAQPQPQPQPSPAPAPANFNPPKRPF